MDNESLIDECSHLLIMYSSDTMEKLVKAYFKSGKLTKESRKLAEAYYVLGYCQNIVRI